MTGTCRGIPPARRRVGAASWRSTASAGRTAAQWTRKTSVSSGTVHHHQARPTATSWATAVEPCYAVLDQEFADQPDPRQAALDVTGAPGVEVAHRQAEQPPSEEVERRRVDPDARSKLSR